MKKEHRYYLKVLIDTFNMAFRHNYSSPFPGNDKEIMEVFPLLYYNWLSEDMLDEESVSPYGLICELSDRLSPKGSFTFPFIKTSGSGFRLAAKTFTFDTHPVISDLKTYLDAVSEGRVAETEQGQILLNSPVKIKNKLSQYSEYYVEYLHNLACELKLLSYIPSVNIKVYRVRTGYESFFEYENPDNSIFESIVRASINLCCKKLNVAFPKETPFFTPQFVEELLKKPVGARKIVESILEDYEVDMDFMSGLDAFENYGISDVDEMIVSTTFFINSLIGKWFYTVFGYYLFLIRPFIDPFMDSYYSMQYYLKYGVDYDYALKAAAFYVNPDECSPTPLGREFFGTTYLAATHENEILSKLSFEVVFEKIADYYEFDLPEKDFVEKPTETYIISISCGDKPKYVKKIEFSEFNNIDDLYVEIITSYPMRPIKSFSAFTDESMSPFSEYTNSRSDRPHKKTETTYLSEVFSEVGDKLWLVLNKLPHKNDKKQYYLFVAELIKKGIKVKSKEYPLPWRGDI